MKPTFLKLKLSLLGLLLSVSVLSQENYLPGLIIKTNRDTINGFIDYRNWKITPEKIKFRKNENAETEVFGPCEIREFKVRNEWYVCGVVEMEKSTLNIDNLDRNQELDLITDTVFLQMLVHGEKTLLYNLDKSDRPNFYILTEEGPQLLIYKKFLRKTTDGFHYYDVEDANRKYIGQLTYYLGPDMEIITNCQKTEYTVKSLMNLFSLYYSHSGLSENFIEKHEALKFEFGILAAPTYNTFNPIGTGFPEILEGDYPPVFSLNGGASMNIILPRNFQRWSIYNELLYSSYLFDGYYENTQYGITFSTTDIQIGYSQINYNVMLRYTYNPGPVWLYFNTGLLFNLVLSETNTYSTERITTTDSYIESGLIMEGTRPWEGGYQLGAGIIYKNYSMEFRFQKGNGMSTYNALNIYIDRYRLMFGYTF